MKITLIHRYLGFIVSSFLLAGLLTFSQFALPNLTPPAEAAGSVNCGSTGDCIGITQNMIVGGGGSGMQAGPGGPVNSGSGGTSSPPAQAYGCDPRDRTFCYPTPQYRNRFVPAGVTGQTILTCNPITDPTGIQRKAVGVMFVDEMKVLGWPSDFIPNYQDLTYSQKLQYTVLSGWKRVGEGFCVYPPPTVLLEANAYCILSYDASIDRLKNSFSGAGRVNSKSGVIQNVAAIESNGSCDRTVNVGLGYNPPSGQAGWGQYQANARVSFVYCNFAVTSYDGNRIQKGKCGGTQNVNVGPKYFTLWCNGYSNSLVLKDWTGSDCQGGRLTCSIPTPAKYNGFANSAQALRDGKDGTLLWGTPQVVGGWGMTNWKSSTVINSGSSPRKSSVGDNNTTEQLFKSSVPFGSSMIPGQNLDQKIAFYTAGDAGSPFSMTRNYLYDSWFTASHTEVSAINLKTGALTMRSYDENVFSVKNKCGPQVSPNIDVIRAIGDTIDK